MLSMGSLVDMGVHLNLDNKDILPPAWRKKMKAIKSSPLFTASHQVASFEGTWH